MRVCLLRLSLRVLFCSAFGDDRIYQHDRVVKNQSHGDRLDKVEDHSEGKRESRADKAFDIWGKFSPRDLHRFLRVSVRLGVKSG